MGLLVLKNFAFDQANIVHLMSLSILATCLLDNVWILLEEVTCLSLLGVEGLRVILN